MRDDFYLTDEQRAMRDLVRAVARDRIAPQAAHVDETEAYPAEQIELLGKQGLMGLYIPEAYGGSAMGTLAFCLAVEEIAWACASSATIYLVQYAGGWPIVAAGTEEQKRDRKSTRLNSSHTVIYTPSLHDALPICRRGDRLGVRVVRDHLSRPVRRGLADRRGGNRGAEARSEEHTSELQSHSDLHSFPTRRSSDLPSRRSPGRARRPRPSISSSTPGAGRSSRREPRSRS